MNPGQRALVVINVLGGAAVLGTYAWGFIAQPEAMGALWGGVPEAARGLYTINMFLAAGGYFLFTPYIVFGLLAGEEGAERPRHFAFAALYVAILIPSALWLPMTSAMVESPSTALWWLIRVDLALVAIGSAGLVVALASTSSQRRSRGHALALVGLLPFCLQTIVLDAIVWPIYFASPPG